MNGSVSLLVVTAVLIAGLLAPALALFFAGIPSRRNSLLIAAVISGSLVLAALDWLALGSPLDIAVFQGSLVSVAAAVILAVGLRTGPVRGLLAFLVPWIVLVLVPVGYSVFDVVHGPLAASLGTLDFGGAGVIGISTGTAAIAIALVSRSLGNAVGGWPRRGPVLFAAVALAALVGWIAVSAGSELVLDVTTVQLVSNELLAALAGVVGWIAAQVVNVHRANVAGIVAGIVAGSVVVLPASPWLEPGSVAVLGIAAGILGHVTAVSARRTGLGHWATVVGVLLVPSMLGLVSVGILARGTGLIFSGHADLLSGQLGGLVTVVGYSLVVSLFIAVIVDRLLRLTGSSRLVDETIARLYAAYNARDTVHVLDALHPAVEWPNLAEGTYMSGKDAVLAYWTRQWTEFDPSVTPITSTRLKGGRIAVQVHQVLRDLDGVVLREQTVTHTFRERDGLLDRMEIS